MLLCLDAVNALEMLYFSVMRISYIAAYWHRVPSFVVA